MSFQAEQEPFPLEHRDPGVSQHQFCNALKEGVAGADPQPAVPLESPAAASNP